jgi:hypothetical protein
MTLVISKGITLRKTNNGIVDPDAIIYINNVEKADGENLEYDTAKAIHDFVVGCKQDGIWSAIKASCILAGARTLTGALVPLVGAAPTNNNFVSGDYNRKTGLVGNGSTKYLNSNRAGNADPQNSHHACVYATTANTGTTWYMGSANDATGATNFFSANSVTVQGRNRNTAATTPGRSQSIGLIGMARSSSSQWTLRSAGGDTPYTQNSEAPASSNYGIFLALGYSPASAWGNGRLAFYSIGESLNLTQLDTRVSALITAIGAAF